MISWKLIINKYLKQLINAFICGCLIGIGGVCNLYCIGLGESILGGFLFGLSFLFIALYGYEYYSSKIGYVVENKAPYLLDCLIAIIGNYIGAWVIALVVKMTSLSSISNPLMIGLQQIVEPRVQNGLVFDLFGKSLLSGIVIYLVFNTYKKAEQPIARFLSLFIGAFVLCFVGLDELVSDMFYFNLACLSNYSYGTLFSNLVYVLIGNSLGAMIIPLLRKLKGVLKSI